MSSVKGPEAPSPSHGPELVGDTGKTHLPIKKRAAKAQPAKAKGSGKLASPAESKTVGDITAKAAYTAFKGRTRVVRQIIPESKEHEDTFQDMAKAIKEHAPRRVVVETPSRISDAALARIILKNETVDEVNAAEENRAELEQFIEEMPFVDEVEEENREELAKFLAEMPSVRPEEELAHDLSILTHERIPSSDQVDVKSTTHKLDPKEFVVLKGKNDSIVVKMKNEIKRKDGSTKRVILTGVFKMGKTAPQETLDQIVNRVQAKGYTLRRDKLTPKGQLASPEINTFNEQYRGLKAV